MSHPEKARQTAALRLERIDRKSFVTQTARVSDVILTAALGAIHPRVEKIEGQRRMHTDARVQCGRRLPCPVAHRADELAHLPGGLQRHRTAVAGDQIPIRREARHFDLQPLHRGIHIAHCAARRTLLAHDVPWLESLPQFELHAARGERSEEHTSELQSHLNLVCRLLLEKKKKISM